MRRFAPVLLVIALALVTVGALAASAPPTIQQQLARSKQANRALRSQIADLRLERDAQDAVIEDLQAENLRLKARPEPLDAILQRDPDGLWQAMVAIWRVFPTLPSGSLCGYDRGQNDLPDTYTSFSFYRYTVCTP